MANKEAQLLIDENIYQDSSGGWVAECLEWPNETWIKLGTFDSKRAAIHHLVCTRTNDKDSASYIYADGQTLDDYLR
jgi:hypothetical protein